MAAGAVTLNGDYIVLYCNSFFSSMMGICIEKLIGSSFLELVPEEHRSTFTNFIARSREQTSLEELPLKTASGKVLYIHLAGGCELRDPRNSCLVVTDISARRSAEEALRKAHDGLEQRVEGRTRELRESEERYRLAVKATNDAIYDLNLPENRMECNEAYERSFGRPADRADPWQRWEERIHPEDRDRTVRGIRQAIDGSTDTWTSEYRFLKTDGTWADVYDRAYITRDAAGKAWRVVGAMSDQTERKRAEEALRTAHDSLEQRVEERTRKLFEINRTLLDEVDRRKQAEESLDVKSQNLEEVNTALRVLLKQREGDKSELEENILSNVKELILPYVERLKKSRLDVVQASTIDIIEGNLREITSPIVRTMQGFGLTPKELEVVTYLKTGKTTKQIAELLGVSPRAVEFHRYNIRKKLGLDQKKTNLRAYLLSIQ